jgi:hypothetical protein
MIVKTCLSFAGKIEALLRSFEVNWKKHDLRLMKSESVKSNLTVNFVGDNYARNGRPIFLQFCIPF